VASVLGIGASPWLGKTPEPGHIQIVLGAAYKLPLGFGQPATAGPSGAV
jgi:hypothetical protein